MPEFSDGADVAHEAKRDLRVTVLARRRSLTAPARAEAAARVQAELVSLVRRLRPTRLTAYVPVASEPGGGDLPAVLRAALAPAAELLLPVLRDDLDLDWAAYTDAASLRAAGRGLREPVGALLGPAAVATAGLVIVPALAVDRRGRRLGRGGGSYDRALARVPAATLTVALLHDGEFVDAVPGEEHDRPVRAVITPGAGLIEVPGVGRGSSSGRTRVR
ncbi:5-formyltetrahydrofolate cyclo-ligase [Micromonospora soli]|uniref:5-formyltetrahydrofolate cyclo-ligase n=1 Tax=Micromonospora sp. NBRC 110009 TaxID=3061627 RepID=UPI0026714D98|nr:5-formyltetrahydrofolate cyclo-ligase [Micromonospora sp. NBRC 110009]WKU00334.1 5-formyltetrahydrofolate cyclo-ligase [Micromonospora sp. NBRC 110009]